MPHCAARETFLATPLTKPKYLTNNSVLCSPKNPPDSCPLPLYYKLSSKFPLQLDRYRTTGKKLTWLQYSKRVTSTSLVIISLTCIASQIMEHIIIGNLMKHLEIQNILFPLQHGFRRNHSCESQLLSLFQDLASSTTQTDMLIMGFSKAFDKVLHKRLNYKLNWYGIRGDALEWITDFLSSRSQRIVLDGATSDRAPVLSWDPYFS